MLLVGKVDGLNRVTIISPHQSTNGDGTFMEFSVQAAATRQLVGQESLTASQYNNRSERYC